MSGFMKTVLIITQPPWHFFSRKYTGFFTQWTTGRLSTHSLLTNLSSVWLAACRLLRLQGMASRVCPAKKISSLTNENTSLFDPPLPPGVELRGPAWYELVARHLGYLPQPSSTETPLAFQAPQRSPCRLLPAGRRESFAPNLTWFS